MYSYVSHTIDK